MTASTRESFPAGLVNAFLFAFFNALSFQIVLNSPMILYAKALGASATVLGIIAGMMPLLVIFQIPAASYVMRVGYKKFVFGGWGIRVMFIFIMGLVPLTGVFLNPTSRLALLLMLLFAFNLSRGISSCAWLPWITSLVPVPLRGRYLALEAAYVNIGSAVTFALAALCLGRQPLPWQFAVIFVFSAAMGVASLAFLKRIPEGETLAEVRVSAAPVPWGEIARFAPFRRILRANVAFSSAYGGLTTFIVAFLKTEAHLSEQTILFVTATSFLGGLGSLWLLGSRLDHLGSKPVLTFSIVCWLLILAGWGLVAGSLLPPKFSLVLLLQLFMGLATSLFNMANVRLAMATIPVMGRNHFFAMFSVVANLTQGISPIAWGLLIDALGPLHFQWHGFVWTRFSAFFTAVEAVFIATLILCRFLDEPAALNMEDLARDLLRSPARLWLRLWPRS
jgi:MFS family permease